MSGEEKGEKKKGAQARKSEVIKQLIFSPVVCTHRCEMGGGRCSGGKARSVSSTDTFYGYRCCTKMTTTSVIHHGSIFSFDTWPREGEGEASWLLTTSPFVRSRPPFFLLPPRELVSSQAGLEIYTRVGGSTSRQPCIFDITQLGFYCDSFLSTDLANKIKNNLTGTPR